MNSENRRNMLLVPNLELGGSERQAVLLALTLRRKHQDVAVATFHGGGPFAVELVRAGVWSSRARLGAAARDRIISNFSLDRLADETMVALASLA